MFIFLISKILPGNVDCSFSYKMEQRKDFDDMYKFVLIGNAGVGKSSLLLQLTESKFKASYITTIGVDFKIHKLNLDGERYKLHVWDTAGQERFKTIVTTYYRGAQGVLIVYDVTNEDSYLDLRYWLHEIHQNCSGAAIIIVGNKCDMTEGQVVKTESGEQFAREHGLSFFETSAKENINVYKVFEELTRQVKKIESDSRNMDISDFNPIIPLERDDSTGGGTRKCC